MFLLLIFLLFTKSNTKTTKSNEIKAITQHVPLNENKKFSYILAIGYVDRDPDTFCTGSLIDESWVLTAGICVAENSKYFVTYTTIFDTSVEVRVLSTILHPEYTLDKYANNIALMKIEAIRDISAHAQLIMTEFTNRKDLHVHYISNRFDPITNYSLHLQTLTIQPCPNYAPLILAKTEANFICTTSPSDPELHKGAQLLFNVTNVIGIQSGIPNKFVPISDHFNWIREELEKNPLRISVGIAVEFDGD